MQTGSLKDCGRVLEGVASVARTEKEKRLKPEASTAASAGKARILIVDDHPIFRQGLADLLNRQTDITCSADVGTSAEAWRALEDGKLDLVLLDLRLNPGDGLEITKAFRARFPELKILVLSQFDEAVYAERALRAGALGYVMKERAAEDVLQAIRTVLAGDLYVSPEVGMMAVSRLLQEKAPANTSSLNSLSDRELCIFKAIGAGKRNKEIAADLNLSVKTIETYKERLKFKLGFATGEELAREARRVVESEIPSSRPTGTAKPP
jgi:DNA-binding NarL/FixJ family response regulator